MSATPIMPADRERGRAFFPSRPLWTAGATLIALVCALPIAVVFLSLFQPSGEAWDHIRQTVLPRYILNTAGLMLGVGIVATMIGVGTAWLIAATRFPGRNFLSWAVVAPFAAPAYVIAYVYTDLLDYAGPVQTGLRALTGWSARDYRFPEIRSFGGAIMVLGLVLYPYIYLLARTAFQRQAAPLFEAARSLNAGPWTAFWKISLPVARPAIAGGLALVLMETVADFGVVEYFGVQTFTTGIFRTWFALGDQAAAARLAAWLFIFVALLILLEAFSRRGRTANPAMRAEAAAPSYLKGWKAFGAFCFCAAPVLLGFVIPAGLLLYYAITLGDPLFGRNFLDFVWNSFKVGGLAALIAALFALVLVYAVRLQPAHGASRLVTRLMTRIATLGYALPGAFLAVGILIPLTRFDKILAVWSRDHLDESWGLVLTGTTAALIFAYVARFLTAAYNSCHSGLEKIPSNMDGAARSLGAPPLEVLRHIHLPLMKHSVFVALLIVFIDVIKELPATLILRPFNFETLATRVYRLAADERLAEASTAALLIVLLGLVPTILVNRMVNKG